MSDGYGSGLGNLSAGMSGARTTRGGGQGIEMSFQWEPDAETIQMGFERWASLIKDWRPAFTDIANLFRKHEKRHLDSQGASTGEKFEALSDRYAAWKERNFPGRPILVLRGTLREALTKKGAPGSLELKTAKSMVVGINPAYTTPQGVRLETYVRAHSRGDGVPRRPPIRYDPTVHTSKLKGLALTGGDVSFGTAAAQIIQVYIVKARKEAFGSADTSAKFNHRAKIRAIFQLKTK